MLKKIAIPIVNEKLCLHFGHCEKFMVFNIENKKIINTEFLTPPPHEPGVLPKLMSEQNVNIIIAGGMGMKAQELFKNYGIEVMVGANSENAKKIVEDFLNGNLTTGENVCDH